MMEAETVAITLGLGGSSIVLPRGHELVKHLEALLPNSTKTVSMPMPVRSLSPPLTAENRMGDAVAALATLARQSGVPQTLPALPRHLFHHISPKSSPTSVGAPIVNNNPSTPSSYHSDSSSTSSSSVPCNARASTTGIRRRRAGNAAQTSGKKCHMPDCDKISVSRGLCRGHGGGRRCQFDGCAKGAQSRSDFCWAHGGGQRCEVKNCMRSRKSKRFCVAHLNWEAAEAGMALPTGEMTARVVETHKMLMPRIVAPCLPEPIHCGAAKLPSLQQALQKHQCVSAALHQPARGFASFAPIINGASG